jgi:hypothetical protein
MSIDKYQHGMFWFYWADYDSDETLIREFAKGHDQNMFSTLRDHLNLDRTYSFPSLLGLNHKSIYTWLQGHSKWLIWLAGLGLRNNAKG